jgi:monoamine oxidase
MNRRKFLTKSLVTLASMAVSLETLAMPNPRRNRPTDKTVLVIGAGMAGIAAAYHLQQQGFQVKILEAQGQIGGRICTNRTTGVVFDEGASWIHHPIDNPITPIAQQAGVMTYRTDDASVQVFDKYGQPYAETLLDKYEQEYEEIIKKVQKKWRVK